MEQAKTVKPSQRTGWPLTDAAEKKAFVGKDYAFAFGFMTEHAAFMESDRARLIEALRWALPRVHSMDGAERSRYAQVSTLLRSLGESA